MILTSSPAIEGASHWPLGEKENGLRRVVLGKSSFRVEIGIFVIQQGKIYLYVGRIDLRKFVQVKE